jgi:predicted metal-binding protein
MDKNLLEQQLSELPLYTFFYIDPAQLEFSDRIRYICQAECPRYGKSWACPPGVGSVTECKAKCLGYQECLVVGTITECLDIADIDETLATRPEHEKLTDQVADMLRDMGIEPYILSTDSCAICENCTFPEGKPCRHLDRMHPCIESHGINIIPALEENGLEFQYGGNIITWYSMLFYNP